MVKLGKPKASFDKAIAEIEAYIKNPSVIINKTFPTRFFHELL